MENDNFMMAYDEKSSFCMSDDEIFSLYDGE
jgi:hypothetical protein